MPEVLVVTWVHNEFIPEELCPQLLSSRHHVWVPDVGVIDNAVPNGSDTVWTAYVVSQSLHSLSYMVK
jgi:hypothetical protein